MRESTSTNIYVEVAEQSRSGHGNAFGVTILVMAEAESDSERKWSFWSVFCRGGVAAPPEEPGEWCDTCHL